MNPCLVFLLSAGVFYATTSLQWREFEARETGRPWLCMSLNVIASTLSAIAATFMWHQRQEGAVSDQLGITLACALSSWAAARRVRLKLSSVSATAGYLDEYDIASGRESHATAPDGHEPASHCDPPAGHDVTLRSPTG